VGGSASMVFAFFAAALAAAPAAVEPLLPMMAALNWGSCRNGRKERCGAGAERKEEDDDGGGMG
jgi:hypothetical protein